MTDTITKADTITNVHQALQAARIELCGEGISKDRQAPQAVGGYAFRGIDDIYNVIGPLLAKYGISFTPQVEDIKHHTRSDAKGRVVNHYVLRCAYLITFAGDPDKCISVTVFGEGMDTADKGLNKAMTSCYKNAIFQTFAPPLTGTPLDMDDRTEIETRKDRPVDHPVDAESDAPEPVVTAASAEQVSHLQSIINLSQDKERALAAILKRFQVTAIGKLTDVQYGEAVDFFAPMIQKAGTELPEGLSLEKIQ